MPRGASCGLSGVPRWWSYSRRPHRALPHWRGSAWTPRGHRPRARDGNISLGNREIPRPSARRWEALVRRAHREAQGRTTMSHGRGKSDCCVVPKKLPNKAAGEILRRRRWWREGGRPREMPSRRACPGERCGFTTWEPRSMAYDRRQRGRQWCEVHRTAASHLRGRTPARRPTSRSSAMRQQGWTARPGSRTGRTCRANLLDLSDRLARGGYRPQPVKRVVHRQGRRE